MKSADQWRIRGTRTNPDNRRCVRRAATRDWVNEPGETRRAWENYRRRRHRTANGTWWQGSPDRCSQRCCLRSLDPGHCRARRSAGQRQWHSPTVRGGSYSWHFSRFHSRVRTRYDDKPVVCPDVFEAAHRASGPSRSRTVRAPSRRKAAGWPGLRGVSEAPDVPKTGASDYLSPGHPRAHYLPEMR